MYCLRISDKAFSYYGFANNKACRGYIDIADLETSRGATWMTKLLIFLLDTALANERLLIGLTLVIVTKSLMAMYDP